MVPLAPLTLFCGLELRKKIFTAGVGEAKSGISSSMSGVEKSLVNWRYLEKKYQI